jgi:hypothetical protein
MNGAVKFVTSKEYDPSAAMGVEATIVGFDESLRYTVPTIGVPVAATPETVLAVGDVLPALLAPDELPPPHPNNIIDKTIVIAAKKNLSHTSLPPLCDSYNTLFICRLTPAELSYSPTRYFSSSRPKPIARFFSVTRSAIKYRMQ